MKTVIDCMCYPVMTIQFIMSHPVMTIQFDTANNDEHVMSAMNTGDLPTKSHSTNKPFVLEQLWTCSKV